MIRKIIDMHTHCFPLDLANRALTSTTLKCQFSGDGTLDCQRKLMKKFGISNSVMLSMAKSPDTQDDVNDFALRSNSKDIIAFGSVHPFSKNAVRTVEMLCEAGIKGIKFHNSHQQFDLSDYRCRLLYRRIGQLGMITVVHGGRSRRSAEHWVWPSEVREVIDCFGGAPFIYAHIGGMSLSEVELTILKDLPVLVDTAMISNWMKHEEFSIIVRELGSKRILFGSDLPWGRLDQAIDFVENAKLSDEEKNNIFYGNALKLLDLDCENK